MPFLEPECWDKHLFQNIKCDSIIPVDDPTVWTYFPELRWTANKLALCEIQGIKCGPHGVYPDFWPVFSKPIMNLWGMGIGTTTIKSEKEMDDRYNPGHFWMDCLTGKHYSVDIVLLDGKPKWWAHSEAYGYFRGTFDFWEIYESKTVKLESLFDISFLNNFSTYTGVLNLEIIGGKIIECQPRLSPQFVPIYGNKWLTQIASLYDKKKWTSIKTIKGYSIPLFLNNGGFPPIIDSLLVREIKKAPEILDVQICIDNDGDINGLANPPGGERIAIISAKTLDEGYIAKNMLMSSFLTVSA